MNIEYIVATPDKTELLLYDVTGSQVKLLRYEKLAPGPWLLPGENKHQRPRQRYLLYYS
ncbi:MAG: hypothetical protein ACPL28_10455 [bacterium]